MQHIYNPSKKILFQIILSSIIILLFLSNCNKQKITKQKNLKNIQKPNLAAQTKKTDNQYYYLVKGENGNINQEGKVLLHLSEDDSLWINPKKVYSLHLYPNWENKIFPDEVFNFPNLEYLWIAMRDFDKLPRKITQLKKLKLLDLQHSGLTKLPDNIGELIELEELNLLYSKIDILPNSICQLSNLKNLNLWQTQMKELPKCLKELKRLEKFSFSHENEKGLNKKLESQIKELDKDLESCIFFLKDE